MQQMTAPASEHMKTRRFPRNPIIQTKVMFPNKAIKPNIDCKSTREKNPNNFHFLNVAVASAYRGPIWIYWHGVRLQNQYQKRSHRRIAGKLSKCKQNNRNCKWFHSTAPK